MNNEDEKNYTLLQEVIIDFCEQNKMLVTDIILALEILKFQYTQRLLNNDKD